MKLPSTSTYSMPNGIYTGTITKCYVEKPKISIVITNTDGTTCRTSWKAWQDDGTVNQTGGANAFSQFACGVLDLDDTSREEMEMEDAPELMVGATIIYENRKHLSTKTGEYYNRFYFKKLIHPATPTTPKGVDVRDYAISKLELKYPPRKVAGVYILGLAGVDLIRVKCNSKGELEEGERIWALAPKPPYDWEWNLTFEEAFTRAEWRHRAINGRGWRKWEKNNGQ